MNEKPEPEQPTRLSRQVALEWQASQYPGSTLPEICMDLRGAVNGSCDPCLPHEVRQAVAMLRVRLKTWAPACSHQSEKFDDAVYRMVVATLEEVDSYDWWQKENKQ